VEVSHLHEHVRTPWANAEAYIVGMSRKWCSPEMQQLCDQVQLALLSFLWAGDVCSFSNPEPTARLAVYFSKDWLLTTHVNQQLDILQYDLGRRGNVDCKIVGPTFFNKVLELHCNRNWIPYSKNIGGACHVWTIGEELAGKLRSQMGGVANVDESHWVGIVVETANKVLLYGDSLGGSDKELTTAILWWIKQHTQITFKQGCLLITKQIDSYNCPIFATNSITSHLCPGEVDLIPDSVADQERIEAFVHVAKRDHELVSRL
jgi:hypothetical protein